MSLSTSIDFARLMRLRLVIARYGEMDGAKWWNTKGVLGRNGALLMSRGFVRTHPFAQARVAFAVAKARSREIFDPPRSMTLWSLPATIEDQFDSSWHVWLNQMDVWKPFFEQVQQLPSEDLLETLERFALLTPAQSDAARQMRLSAEGRAVPISGSFSPTNEILTLLAAGFARGENGKPAIPYARLDS